MSFCEFNRWRRVFGRILIRRALLLSGSFCSDLGQVGNVVRSELRWVVRGRAPGSEIPRSRYRTQD